MEYYGAIDQGTTSSRFIVFDNEGNIVEQHQEEFNQYFPNEYSVEHNPEEIWKSVVNCINEVLKKIDVNSIKSIGITNQRETTVAWSKSTGKPLFNAIVWQAKILWLIENVPEVHSSLENEDVIFGTIDSWLIYKLNGTFQTDVTNASRTLLLDLHNLNWNNNLLNEFNIPSKSLPIIKPSLHNYGECKNILEGIPITAVLGDQQASLFGQHCFKKGEVKNTYGTGCFALTNTGDDIIYSKNGLLTTIAYQYGEKNVKYALEGSVAIAGAAVQWLRDNLNLIETSEQVESYALEEKNNGGVYFVPAFSGLFSPHWDETARGVLVGLTRYSNRNHICRAVLESVAYQSYELLEAMEKDTGFKFNEVKVDGGMVNNNLLMQFQSDIFNKNIISRDIQEITAYGAGIASYISFNGIEVEDLDIDIKKSNSWSPNINETSRSEYISLWNKAIEKSKNWL